MTKKPNTKNKKKQKTKNLGNKNQKPENQKT